MFQDCIGLCAIRVAPRFEISLHAEFNSWRRRDKCFTFLSVALSWVMIYENISFSLARSTQRSTVNVVASIIYYFIEKEEGKK